MNNQESNIDKILAENGYLHRKIQILTSTLANQIDYTVDIETQLDIANETIKNLYEQEKEQEQAQG
ncbi:hypothetical protein JTZ62_04345 [Mammaliicoccus sciuri]|uniref:hypothetical protein n=1 Tax=Mammaliicoccus sciuri TaxID=1296 RepID=UPI0019D33097|nr:hypothetical protein [Mammaliicoccus sciuri]QSN68392.1 hypothetical protein JTZ62_04345 [Mammaliicoccus sciuri]UIU23130.1 hypothetical protein LLZ87_04355 [Mammaliicoccus sciuri]UIU26035.1 hypothetical protein LLZ92_04355 [Mammaliicoccus sciuri]